MNRCNNKILVLIVMMVVSASLAALKLVPPHPDKKDNELFYSCEEYRNKGRALVNLRDTPDSILVLLIDFSDLSFDMIPDYPDSLAHDIDYFERYMLHLSDYLFDASLGNYEMKNKKQFPAANATYYVHETVFTLPQTMAYYGNDELSSERTAEFVRDVVNVSDSLINYSNYDSYLIFHAGAGQEADIHDQNEDQLWSTFVSQNDIWEGLYPEAENFHGLETNDGALLKEFIICPETEWQPDFTQGDRVLGMLGVIAHQFGHQLGLPTLFDNIGDNGYSSGIGNFGLMGTGTWNADGYVPPLPCAWSRYYMGWDLPQTISSENAEHFFDSQEIKYPRIGIETPTIYKVMISEAEYFLLENRQQNPDKSVDINGDPSFSFELLPESEQDVYPPGHDLAGQPKFNFMENRYRGCEWDFYLPGLGGPDSPPVDGSGILIWHVDENIIESDFDQDFANNYPNGDAQHKGVDLEEADMIQHLDTIYDIYSRGSAYDAYRQNNNSYFGQKTNPNTGMVSTPTSESYYGGNVLEIKEISTSDTVMSFKVNYNWSLDTDFQGENIAPAAFIDLNNNDNKEIFYPMSDGSLAIWEDEILTEMNTTFQDSLLRTSLYAYDEINKQIYLTTVTDNGLYVVNRLWFSNNEYLIDEKIIEDDYKICNNPVILNKSTDQHLALALNSKNNQKSEIRLLNHSFSFTDTLLLEDCLIKSNLVYDKENIYFLSARDSLLNFNSYDLDEEDNQSFNLGIREQRIISAFKYPFKKIENTLTYRYGFLTETGSLFVFDEDFQAVDGFPTMISMNAYHEPVIQDFSQNGFLDILIGGENRFVIVDYKGNYDTISLNSTDSLAIASGVLSLDIDSDGEKEIVGNFSHNRLVAWEENFDLVNGYPVSLGNRSRFLPKFEYDNGAAFVYISCDNGSIFRKELKAISNDDINNLAWYTECANYQRTAFYGDYLPQSNYGIESIFVDEKVYVYPNPANWINGFIPKFNIMVTEDVEVMVKIYNVAADLLYNENVYCSAYLNNRDKIDLSEIKFSSGVYFAVLKARNETKKIKFAIEK